MTERLQKLKSLTEPTTKKKPLRHTVKVPKMHPPSVSPKSYCILDPKTKATYGHNHLIAREIASLTKITTCVVSLKLRKKFSVDWNTKVEVSKASSSKKGTSAQLKEGDVLKLHDLFFGLMLPSGNDAAWALAEFFGSLVSPLDPVKAFIKEMNQFAKDHKLLLTSFGNPHGLCQKRNLSTASDVCKIAQLALEDPDFLNIVKTQSYKASVTNGGVCREQTWTNSNKLIGKGFFGKTGITPKAGPCLCVTNDKFIITLLSSRSREARWREVKVLANWASKIK